MLQDVIVAIGLGLLTFVLIAGWFATVAKATSTPIPQKSLYIAGAFCAAMTLFFIVVAVLHLGHRLFGWMVR